MRSVLAIMMGLFALLAALMAWLPQIHPRIWLQQMVITELSWFTVALSALSFLLRPVHWLGRLPSLLALLLAMLVYRRLPATVTQVDAMMMQGFGLDYLSQIPAWHPLHSPSRLRSPRRTPAYEDVIVVHDVPYRHTDSRDLLLDIYQPTADAVPAACPAVVIVHGGSWMSGDKGEYFSSHCRHLALQGYVVFDIQYRFSQEAHWPAQIEDVEAALGWIRGHAGLYRVDVQRIAILGRSAGGHLALQAAYRLQGLCAVIGVYPPVDLLFWHVQPGSSIARLIGAMPDENAAAWEDANVVAHVSDSAPPTLLIHGDRDAIVPIAHSEHLSGVLQNHQIPNALVRVPWARHGFDGVPGVGSYLSNHAIDRFLAWAFYRPQVSDPI